MGTEYTHIFINLMLVVGLILLFVFLLKKFKLAKFSGNKDIKIVNVVSLGAREKIVLMEVRDFTLLVGVTPTHIQALHVFNTPASMETTAFAETLKNVGQKTVTQKPI